MYRSKIENISDRLRAAVVRRPWCPWRTAPPTAVVKALACEADAAKKALSTRGVPKAFPVICKKVLSLAEKLDVLNTVNEQLARKTIDTARAWTTTLNTQHRLEVCQYRKECHALQPQSKAGSWCQVWEPQRVPSHLVQTSSRCRYELRRQHFTRKGNGNSRQTGQYLLCGIEWLDRPIPKKAQHRL